MKFLFTAPRFHTNQVPIVKGLTEKGHEVRYFVVFVGATEDHTYCEPLVLKPSKTTMKEKKKLARTKTASDTESIIGGHFIPDYPFLQKAFEEYMPDVVICREKTNLSLCVKSLCDRYNMPCILYDQEPLYQLKSTQAPISSVSVQNSLIRRGQIKLQRKLNPELRMLMQMKRTIAFPTVRMTPVKYKCLPKTLSEKEPANHTYYIPFVAEQHNEIAQRKYCENNTIHFLCVGKYRQYKRINILVNAVAMLANDIKWALTIIGQAKSQDEKEYYAQINELVKVKGLEDRVTVLTEVPHEKIGEFYRNHDLFILPSRREYANIAIIEAMSYGIAVISTDYNGTASYVEDAESGVIFKTENENDLADRITDICKADIPSLGQKSYQFTNNFLSFNQYYSALSNMLKKEFEIVLE